MTDELETEQVYCHWCFLKYGRRLAHETNECMAVVLAFAPNETCAEVSAKRVWRRKLERELKLYAQKEG